MLTALAIIFCNFVRGQKIKGLNITDVYTNKARYAPHEKVFILVSLKNDPLKKTSTPDIVQATLKITFWHLGKRVCHEITRSVSVSGQRPIQVAIPWMPPDRDFFGYFVDVRLLGLDGKDLDRSQTAIDVSSEWNRFPRYGYLAHYSKTEGAAPNQWIAELNKFHIDGLEYYDFQDRHEHPLAGSVEHPASHWQDIAGREIDRDVLDEFLTAAHKRNMMNMAYNTSYSAYADAFTDGEGIKLQWATWSTPGGPRTLQTAKALNLNGGEDWKTHRLIYMNQNGPDWQNYLFGQMADLFRVYPFDGWHIDTFGTRGAYAYDGNYVNFIAGFRPFIDRAKDVLHKRMVLNTVNTLGQDRTAHSTADFVYSELWEDHETYASILSAASQVHKANPAAGLVFAAYLHRRDGKQRIDPKTTEFNTPSVLLADAVIFASGASHIELGDGSRMLSSEYFPTDTTFSVSPELHSALRHYYDFLTAYENVLRYKVASAPARAVVLDHPSSPNGVPATIWTIARHKKGMTIVHLINLLGSDDPHWRDIKADRPATPLLTNIKVRIYADQNTRTVGWATPDADGGRFHHLSFTTGSEHGQRYMDIILPSLKYWDMLLLQGSVNP